MLNSIIGSIMNMSADIFMQQNTQDPNSGAIVREWVYEKTIPCKIEPFKARGTSSKGDGKNFAAGNNAQAEYNEGLLLKMKCTELLSKRWRINFIKSSDGLPVFVEIDRYGNPDSVFEVIASHAVLDPFGKVSYYEATLKRVPIQTNDKTIN
jgi:hypothetical protein